MLFLVHGWIKLDNDTIYVFVDVIINPCSYSNGDAVWMSNYTPHLYIGVITHSDSKPIGILPDILW